MSFFAIGQSQVEPDMQAQVLSLLQSVGIAPLANRLSLQLWFLLSRAWCVLIALSGPFVPTGMNIKSPRSGTPVSVFG